MENARHVFENSDDKMASREVPNRSRDTENIQSM